MNYSPLLNIRLSRYHKLVYRIQSQQRSGSKLQQYLKRAHRYERQLQLMGVTGLLSAGMFLPGALNAQDPCCEVDLDEYVVNDNTLADQIRPAIAADRFGNFVVTWQGSDASGWGIFARVHSNDGTPLTMDLEVNTVMTSDQLRPDVAMDDDGNFIVVWKDDNSQKGKFRKFAADGTALTDEIEVAGSDFGSTSTNAFPSIGMDDFGNFVIAWMDELNINTRVFNADCSPRTGVIPVVTNSISNTFGVPDVAMDADGDFAVSWIDLNENDVHIQLFDANGNFEEFVDGSLSINSVGMEDQAIAMDAVGNFAVVWYEELGTGGYESIKFQKFDANGMAIGSEVIVQSETSAQLFASPDIAMDANGYFAITWVDKILSSEGYVNARLYRPDCSPKSDQFNVNSTSRSDIHPRVAVDGEGEFIFAWEWHSSDYDVFVDTYACIKATNYSEGEPMGFDPCSCDDPLNYYIGNTLYFHDYVEITDNVSNRLWKLTDVDPNLMFDNMGNELPLNTPLVQQSEFVHRLDFWHVASIGFSATFTDLAESEGVEQPFNNVCEDECEAIPTLSQWGLIFLGLLLSIFSVVFYKNRKPNLSRFKV